MRTVIGLTGPTGSGKSSACRVAAAKGFQIVDCDLLARKAVEKGMPGLSALIGVFGADILSANGQLNRKRLAEKAFASRQNTELLNQTLLPFITELIREQITGNTVLLDAPTLFESGADSLCDQTIAVLADRQIRLNRIIARDHLTIKEAELRIRAGQTDTFYREKADHILYNNGDESAFQKSFEDTVNLIIGGKHHGRKNTGCQDTEKTAFL